MKKSVLCFILISLILGFTAVYVLKGDDTEPFVGKWDYWTEDNHYFELELDLYGSPTDGYYGICIDDFEDTSMQYFIQNVTSVRRNVAEVEVNSFMGTEKASLKYDPESGDISFLPADSDTPILFKQKDKYGFVITSGDDTVNVFSAPVSGSPLISANRGQSFRFLGKQDGWFKVELSDKDNSIGYISPQYVFYLKDNTIPEEALLKEYSNKETSIWFEESGTHIFMHKDTMRPLPDEEGFLPAIVETYAGKIEGNALVFTYYTDFPPMPLDVNEMSEIEPYVVYYFKDSEMFIMDGKNYFNW